jgi:hypothetical protein
VIDHDDLLATWHAVEARLPDGWHLDGLRCASTGLDPASRSDDWCAAAIGPGGVRVERCAASAIGALTELANQVGIA